MLIGALIFALGLRVWVGDSFGFKLFRLPGDFRWEIGNGQVYFPLTSGIILSILLSLLLRLWRYFY
jgi:hypothetical protein